MTGACRTTRKPPVIESRPSLPVPTYTGSPTSVAIVGAGLAGLHCAYRLSKLGIAATVYEASKRTGGRIFTDHMTFPDQHVELGGEFIESGHTTLRMLAKELAVELVEVNAGEPKYFANGRLFPAADVTAALAPALRALQQVRQRFTDPSKLPGARDPNGAEALDRMSIAAWLDRAAVSPREPARKLLESLCASRFGLDADDLSAVHLLTLPLEKGIAPSMDGSFRIKEGSDALVRRIVEKLELWQVRYDHKLTAMEKSSGGRWTLTFEQTGQIAEMKHEHVVLALPFSTLREVEFRSALPDWKERVIRELGYGRSTKVLTGYADRVWRTVHEFGGSIVADLPFEVAWDASSDPASKTGVIAVNPGGQRADEAAFGSAFEAGRRTVEQLASIFPSIKSAHNGRVARMAWGAAPFAKGSRAAYRPGQFTTLRGLEAEAVGNLHFAGEHTSNAPGTMDAAAESGARAAREVAKAMGIDAA
jgi:monoamine oxidase